MEALVLFYCTGDFYLSRSKSVLDSDIAALGPEQLTVNSPLFFSLKSHPLGDRWTLPRDEERSRMQQVSFLCPGQRWGCGMWSTPILLVSAARVLAFHRAGFKLLRYLRNVICLCFLLQFSRSGPASSHVFSHTLSDLACSSSSFLLTCIALINVCVCFTHYVCGRFVRESGHSCLCSQCSIKRDGFLINLKKGRNYNWSFCNLVTRLVCCVMQNLVLKLVWNTSFKFSRKNQEAHLKID